MKLSDWKISAAFCAWSAALCLPMRAATVDVAISNFAFAPGTKTINVGDSVKWVNNDGFAHTSARSDAGTPANAWDSSALEQGASFTRAFSNPGSYDYFCGIHPSMVGTIVVQAAQEATVAITSPANNTAIAAPVSVMIEASATAGANPVAKVEFFDGATLLGFDDSAPYTFTANFTAGAHSLTAKATDSAGASVVSSAVAVTVGGGGTRITDPIPAKIAKGNVTVQLQTIVEGLVAPLGLVVPDDGSGREFLYDQVGLIHIIENGARLETPLLDVRSRLVALGANYDERGLLGVAAHPDFANHPFIYTYTSEPTAGAADFPIPVQAPTTNNHQSVIAEWRIDAGNTNRLDPASRREILRIDKPQSNHNGGTARFGPDGFLYFTVGDGGAADDQGAGHSPGGNGQDKTKILGKISRIDVDARTSPNGQYGIPAENPFAGQSGVVQEIFAYGLRNPYSFTFDRGSGDLYLADVGQNNVEEIDKIVKGGNFGWPIKEGAFFFDPNGGDPGFTTTAPVREVPADVIDPIGQYDHDEGLAIISGYLYRGAAIPGLSGKYVFGDWGKFTAPEGRLFYLEGSDVKELRIGAADSPLGLWLKGYGQDANGELYIMASTNSGPSGTSGRMLKLLPLEFRITQFARNENTLTLTWTGGAAPYTIQRKSDIAGAVWTDVKTVTETTAEALIEGGEGYFRISSATSP